MTIEIEILDPQGQSFRQRFEGSPIRIGRDAQNDLVLPYPFVSSWHGVLRELGTGEQVGAEGKAPVSRLAYFDLGSTNGSRFQGQRLAPGQAAPLDAGLPIEIGQIELRFLRLSAADAAPEPASGTWTQAPPMQDPGSSSPLPATDATPDFVPATLPGSPPGTAPGWIPDNPPHTDSVPASITPESNPPPAMAPHAAQVDLQRVRTVVNQLQPLIDRARTARDQFLSAQDQTLARMAPAERVVALAWLQGEEEFLDPRFDPHLGPAADISDTQPSPAYPRDPTASPSSVSSPLHRAPDLADYADQKSAQQSQALLSALVEGLFCLLQGQHQVARDLGVSAQRKKTRLHVAETPQEMQRRLSDPEVALHERLAALQSVIHDLKVFNVAQLNAFRAGAEALLLQLSPQNIEASRCGTWTNRHKALWQEFSERYASICEDERALVSTLFGADFIRAFSHYWESMQKISPNSQPGAQPDPQSPGPSSRSPHCPSP